MMLRSRSTTSDQANAILRLLRGQRFVLSAEKELQQDIHDLLEGAGIAHEREVQLSEGVIDFLTVAGVGIEVKVGGAKRTIYRQCVRYCCAKRVRALLVVSARPIGLPGIILGKPVYVLSLGQAWL